MSRPMLSARSIVALVSLSTLTAGAPAAAQAPPADAVRVIPVQSRGFHIRLSPDGSTAALFEDATLLDNMVDPARLPIRLIDLPSGEPAAELAGATDYAADVAFSPDGTQLAALHWNGQLDFWDLAAEPERSLSVRSGNIGGSRIAYAADGATLVALNGAVPQRFYLFDKRTGAIPHIMGRDFASFAALRDEHLRGAPFDISYAALALSPAGAILATATLNDEVALWRIPDGQPETLRPPSERVGGINIRRLAFTPDGDRLVYFDRSDERMHVWDVVGRVELASLPLGAGSFGLSPDGLAVAWAEPGEDGRTTVSLADLSGSAEAHAVATLGLEASPDTSVTFTPDGTALVVGGFTANGDANGIAVVPLGSGVAGS